MEIFMAVGVLRADAARADGAQTGFFEDLHGGRVGFLVSTFRPTVSTDCGSEMPWRVNLTMYGADHAGPPPVPGFELPYEPSNHQGTGVNVRRTPSHYGLKPTGGRWLWGTRQNGNFSVPLRVPVDRGRLQVDFGLYHTGVTSGTAELQWTSCALGENATQTLRTFPVADYAYEANDAGDAMIAGMYHTAPLDLLSAGAAGYLTLTVSGTDGAGIALDQARMVP